eukprot:Pompholyxophrys_punicea_v1_NODE_600_length_1613_cov_2.271502.p1 type:complete len:362 gc:universal NODE_600_length_1613_cov_2.271502:1414-329(-)
MPNQRRSSHTQIRMIQRKLCQKIQKYTIFKESKLIKLHFFEGLTWFCIISFLCYWSFFVKSFVFLATHPITLFLILPVAALWILLSKIDGEHHKYLQEIQKNVEFVIWWAGLGVLSSIGLGTGMHSGILFLFPHIFKVVQASEVCHSTYFDSRGDMWFFPHPFTCKNVEPDGSGGFWNIFWKVFPACFLWGVGTALGEIPPYAVSRAARLAGEVDEEFEEITQSTSQWNILNRMKIWMIEFLQSHGFWGVFLMSAWPNMAFDLCGICCGLIYIRLCVCVFQSLFFALRTIRLFQEQRKFGRFSQYKSGAIQIPRRKHHSFLNDFPEIVPPDANFFVSFTSWEFLVAPSYKMAIARTTFTHG